MKGRKRNRN